MYLPATQLSESQHTNRREKQGKVSYQQHKFGIFVTMQGPRTGVLGGESPKFHFCQSVHCTKRQQSLSGTECLLGGSEHIQHVHTTEQRCLFGGYESPLEKKKALDGPFCCTLKIPRAFKAIFVK